MTTSAGTATALVEDFLATLTTASPSTVRQRTWALRELLTAAPTASATTLLSTAVIGPWMAAAAAGEAPAPAPASLPGLRARASAVRALARHAQRHQLIDPAAADALAPLLRLPAPPLAPGPDPDPVRRLLAAAHPDARPRAVHPAVWTRFCAHAHLLALTGEREDVMATLRADDLTPHASADSPTPITPSHLVVTTGRSPATWTLPAPARTALAGWLTSRATLTTALTGSAPTALWLRARASVDRRTGAHRPAGLPLSDRGLRLAFTATVAALALTDPPVADLTTADLRNHARGRRL